jgi:outer membrane immunogenic protein
MRNFVVLFAFAFAGSAAAADMPVKAPIYNAVPPAVWAWNGLYIGGNIGYSWGQSDQ